MKRTLKNIFKKTNEIIRKAVFSGFLIMFSAQSVQAEYSEAYIKALAELEKCAPASAINVKSRLNYIMETLAQQETKKYFDTFETGTPSGQYKLIYEDLRNVKRDIRNGKSKCDQSILETIGEEGRKKATEVTNKWLKYAKDAKDDDAIKNRKEELSKIKQRCDALVNTIEHSDSFEDAMANLDKCDPSKAKKIRNYFKDLESLNDRTNRNSWKSDSKATPAGRQKEITDLLQEINKSITKGESSCSKEDVQNINKEATRIAQDITKRWYDNAVELGKKDAAENRKEELAEIKENSELSECPLVADVKAKHFAGCWACLVIEKMTSAFLNAANKGLRISQRAGIVLLIVGSGIWLVLWGLKNVSSFTEVQIGNILNDLIKFLFKVAIAYWFIIYSQTLISKYFITPIMSVGALVGQQFWDAKVKQYTEDYIPSDELVTDEEFQKIEAEILEANQKDEGEEKTDSGGETKPSENSSEPDANTTPQEEELPRVVEADEFEETVQLFQKALIAILMQMHKEIRASCTNPARMEGSGCSHTCLSQNTCNVAGKSGPADKGHAGYVRDKIFVRSGSSPMVSHYCIASITAALELLNQEVGGDITNFQTGTINCKSGMNVAAKYQNSAVTGTEGIKVKPLKDYLKYANVGDIVYVDWTTSAAAKAGNSGASGFHATCHAGGGTLISFNPDKIPYTSGGKQPGVIIHTSEIFRQRLKKNPNAKINMGKLKQLAAGSNINTSLVNYTGGSFSGVDTTSSGGAFSNGDYSNLIINIPEVKYTGPKNIMPGTIMNSILGATRAITTTTAGVEVLGDVIMCYAGMKNGGAWHEPLMDKYWLNVPMWFSGFVVLCLGYLLTMTIGYYLIDISFKIGFAVLAIPLVMGLWPFDMMKNKLYGVISIIAKSAATFAFLALTTAFGMSMVDSAFDQGGLEELYNAMDYLSDSAVDTDSEEFQEMRSYVAKEIQFSSTKFILIVFSIWYFYKLIQSTSSDLVNKFFPDAVFGDASPMHSGATMVTSFAKKMAMKPVGLARDIVAHQAGQAIHSGLKKGAGGIKAGAKGAFNKAKGAVNKLRGKGGS